MIKPAILRGAKEIAEYMGVSRRTVFRYINHWDLPSREDAKGLPSHDNGTPGVLVSSDAAVQGRERLARLPGISEHLTRQL
jgi:hypothetical protein